MGVAMHAAREVVRIVGAHDRDLGVRLPERVQAREVVPTRALRGRGDPSSEAERPGDGVGPTNLHRLQVRITGMQQPSVVSRDRDPGVPLGVPGERDEGQVVAQTREGTHAREAVPRLAVDGVRSPTYVGVAERGVVAGRATAQGLELGGVDVDGGFGEVEDASGVVTIEVGDDDVADVARSVTERSDVPQGGVFGAKARPQLPTRGPVETPGIGGRGFAETGVDEHEAVARGLDEETMRDHRAAEERTKRPGIEMMNLHAATFTENSPPRRIGMRVEQKPWRGLRTQVTYAS